MLALLGEKVGSDFETKLGGIIIDVFGSSGNRVESIGVYMLNSRTTSKYEVSTQNKDLKL